MLRLDSPLPAEHEKIVTQGVDVGFTVHRELGPGFKEHIYERAYCLELDSRGIRYECEKRIAVRYKSWSIPGQKIDLIIEGIVLVELKTVPRLRPIHRAQVMSYLKTMDLRVGLIMNFNTEVFKAGVKRVVYTPKADFTPSALSDGKRPKNFAPSRLRAFVPSRGRRPLVTRMRLDSVRRPPCGNGFGDASAGTKTLKDFAPSRLRTFARPKASRGTDAARQCSAPAVWRWHRRAAATTR